MKRSLNQKGFSLVELMVVVALIGVLSSLATNFYDNFVMKAREAEAKTMLSGLFVAEKNFYAEYLAYHSSFVALGFAPEGRVRFALGFGDRGIGVGGVANGYTTVLSASQLDAFNTLAYCDTTAIPLGGGPGMPGNSCKFLLTNNSQNFVLFPTSGIYRVNGASFTAGAMIEVPLKMVASNSTLENNLFQMVFGGSRAIAAGSSGYAILNHYLVMSIDQGKNFNTVKYTQTRSNDR